jgi:hypothetical protein
MYRVTPLVDIVSRSSDTATPKAAGSARTAGARTGVRAGFFRIAYGQCNIETWSGPHGANSVALRTMAYNLTLTRAYANTYSKNAWAAFDGLGWRRIHPNAPDGVTNVFGVLAASRANERKVHAQLDGQYVYAAYGT